MSELSLKTGSKYEWIEYLVLGVLFIASLSILLYIVFRNKDVCNPDCDGRVCGDDKCGGMCQPNYCSDQCVDGKCKIDPCTKKCGKVNGVNCGECPIGMKCNDTTNECDGDPCKEKCGNFDGNKCGECKTGNCDDKTHTCTVTPPPDDKSCLDRCKTSVSKGCVFDCSQSGFNCWDSKRGTCNNEPIEHCTSKDDYVWCGK
jgi:hypothetical protein